MTREDLAQLIVNTMREQDDHPIGGTVLDNRSGGLSDVLVDGHFDMLAVADAVLSAVDYDPDGEIRIPAGLKPATREDAEQAAKWRSEELAAMDADLSRISRELDEAGVPFATLDHSENDE